ncbi:HIT family protein [Allocoprobacillus halotolerans]|uniref:HIT family protein n=1 Tax=Allocoprobacillus halotolerans TaxID=2944914 RepID=A0ABY5I6K5_9FIRM|nr:HIT family protein [Allocoprobacillus halotolerans]UTY39587.1 HIT family protein [Allocoprobacillus halotolerans]
MCLICDRIDMIKKGENPYFVKELETGYVVIGDHQHFKGYTLFLYKEHQTELFHLENTQKMKFLEEMTLVAKAVSKAFYAQKMNYELLGNGDSHIHWHLFPRMNGDLDGYGNHGKGPVWWYPMEKMYDDSCCPTMQELEDMKSKLLVELNKIDENRKKNNNE